MKNLIRIFLILTIIGGAVSLHSACSDENDCSLAGRPMMYCTIYTINPDNPTIALKDTLDSLTITALGTDSIILNNEKNVHTLMLPLRYTSDTTVFIFRYDPKRREKDFDTLYIVQQNTPYFQSMECGYMILKSATKPLNVLIAFTRPLITEFADNLNLKHPLLPTISPYPTM
ncbi:MAG: DUF6452 family protein [Bacteroides xylanisolvens]